MRNVLYMFDYILSFAGVVMALVISFAILATALLLPWLIIQEGFRRGPVATILFIPLAGVAFGAYLFVVWRAIRYMGGYVGSSEYPFHFVVRWLFS